MIVVILGSCTKDKTIPPNNITTIDTPIDRHGVYTGMMRSKGGWYYDGWHTIDTSYTSTISVEYMSDNSLSFTVGLEAGTGMFQFYSGRYMEFPLRADEMYFSQGAGGYVSFWFSSDTLFYHLGGNGKIDNTFNGKK